MDLKKLEKILIELKQPAYRYKQLVEFYFKKLPADWTQIKTVPKGLIDEIKDKMLKGEAIKGEE